MNPFEKHNIKHLSASSLGMFRTQPALWVIKYLCGFREDAGPAAWRGSAVEAGFTKWLYEANATEQECVDACYERFNADAQGEVSDDITAENANIAPMLKQAITAFPGRTIPIAKQLKVDTWLDGVECPVIGYIDVIHEGLITDLKTTKACPSEAKPDHCRQMSLYIHGRGYKETGQLLYVTAKKSALYPVDIESAKRHVIDLTRDALALQRFLARVDSGADALGILAPDFDHFMWSDEAKGFALAV